MMSVDWVSLAIEAGWVLLFGVMPFVLTVTDTPLWQVLPCLK